MTSPLPQLVCPNCGSYSLSLDDKTGWCFNCTTGVTGTGTLSTSKIEIAFAANANAIEFYVSTANLSTWQALRLARADRPVCIVCGDRIHRASRSAIFCRRTTECRRYSRRYVYLYSEKHMTKVEALAQIMQELTGE